jgi:hypothetical protein
MDKPTAMSPPMSKSIDVVLLGMAMAIYGYLE